MSDMQGLVAPISEDNPCGVDMSLSPEFDAIIEARRADDPSLEQGEWVTELKAADWPRVADLCTRLLSDKTKDIRVCVWLTEAWGHLDSFSGLASAFSLFSQLCSTDWENLHPLPDDDGDEEARINNVARLLQLSTPLMMQQPITQSSAGAFTAGDLRSARHASSYGQGEDEDDDERGEASSRLAQFESARRDTPGAFYAELLQDLEDCRVTLQRLEQTLDDKLGIDAPGFTRLHETTDEIHQLVQGFAQDAGLDTERSRQSSQTDSAASSERSDPETEQAPEPQPEAGTRQASGPIRSRAQALSQLRMVADYFRRTEPHSPVAYMAETAARWGDMPLHTWLRSVIRDDGELSHVEELLGLTRQPRANGGQSSDSADDGDMYQ